MSKDIRVGSISDIKSHDGYTVAIRTDGVFIDGKKVEDAEQATRIEEIFKYSIGPAIFWDVKEAVQKEKE